MRHDGLGASSASAIAALGLRADAWARCSSDRRSAIAGVGLLIMLGVPLGRLPGDIDVRRGNFTFYFPLATSIVAEHPAHAARLRR